LGALVGCTPPPEPRSIRSGFDTTDVVPYRPLTRDDFRASSATGFTFAEEERIGASTCTKIVVRPGVVTQAIGSAYIASLDAPIFFSVMSRTCSFWSPAEDMPAEQVLEHEQIHFAIDELEARRLNARANEIVARIHTAGTDLGSVSQRAQAELRSILEVAQKAALERGTVFDYQVARDRVRQRQWLHKIEAELEVTQPYARGPQTSVPAAVALAPLPGEPAPITTTTPFASTSSPPPTANTALPAPVAPAPSAGVRPAPSAPPPTGPASSSSPGSTGAFPE
jgi:hypothetical protein